MIIERVALLPPLDDEPPKAKPPTLDELREAGKAGKLRVIVETPDVVTMEAVNEDDPSGAHPVVGGPPIGGIH